MRVGTADTSHNNAQIKERDVVGQADAYRYMALTMIPTIRPKVAPIAMDGTNIPAGTLLPYDMTTKPMRMTVANSSEFATRHCNEVLERKTTCSFIRLTKAVYKDALTGKYC